MAPPGGVCVHKSRGEIQTFLTRTFWLFVDARSAPRSLLGLLQFLRFLCLKKTKTTKKKNIVWMSQTHLSESSSFWTETVLTQTLTHREFFFFLGILRADVIRRKTRPWGRLPSIIAIIHTLTSEAAGHRSDREKMTNMFLGQQSHMQVLTDLSRGECRNTAEEENFVLIIEDRNV